MISTGAPHSAAEMTRRKVTKKDIKLLRNVDKNRKYEIEQSSFYIGYKLLWILSLFLKGKKFPSGDLSEGQFKVHVFNIVDFVTDENTLALLLDFDPEAFFQTVIYLFSGKPWHFLVNCSKSYAFEFAKPAASDNPYTANTAKLADNGQAAANGEQVDLGKKILSVFKMAAERTNRKDPESSRAFFLELVLRIIAAQNKEKREKTTKQPVALDIEYEWIVDAIKSVLSGASITKPSLVETVISGG